jgi:hypothetical protein
VQYLEEMTWYTGSAVLLIVEQTNLFWFDFMQTRY